jgi:hypothetical protein
MFPVSLDCPMFCLPSVACVPDVSSVSRLSVVLWFTRHRRKTKSTTDNLETLETSGTQDTEGRQNIRQSRDTANIRNTGHRCMKIKAQRTMSCVPDVSTVSGLSVVLCSSYFSVLIHMKLLFIFTVYLILWLSTNRVKKSTFMALTSYFPVLKPTTSVCSNVPTYTEPICFVTEGDTSETVESCLQHLTDISEKAFRLLVPRYGMNVIGSSIRVIPVFFWDVDAFVF